MEILHVENLTINHHAASESIICLLNITIILIVVKVHARLNILSLMLRVISASVAELKRLSLHCISIYS